MAWPMVHHSGEPCTRIAGVLAVLVDVERARAERVVEAARLAAAPFHQLRLAGDHLLRRRPGRPFLAVLDVGAARPAEAVLADADAVAQRVAARLHPVEEAAPADAPRWCPAPRRSGRRRSGGAISASIFSNGTSGSTKPSSVNDAYISSGWVTARSTLICGRMPPVVVVSICSASTSIERVHPAAPATRPRPPASRRRRVTRACERPAGEANLVRHAQSMPRGVEPAAILTIHG